jgi:hypothetical protein
MSDIDLLGRVFPSCFRVAEKSRLVQIDRPRLAEFAGELAAALPREMRHTQHHFIGAPESTAGYFLVLDALNFGSGFFEHLEPYNGEHGYYAVARALRDWFHHDGAPSPQTLQSIKPDEVFELMGQPKRPELVQLIDWFTRALRELGQFTQDRLGGRYENLLINADHSAPDMVAMLCEMPMFRDIAMYEGEDVHFLKRAQICVQDIAIASAEPGLSGLGVQGLERLTVFADNMLPFILEAEGVLSYADVLSRQILAGKDLGMGSPAELELRANSIVACELLRQILEIQGVATTAREIDFALWNLGDRKASASAKPLHVCRSYFY